MSSKQPFDDRGWKKKQDASAESDMTKNEFTDSEAVNDIEQLFEETLEEFSSAPAGEGGTANEGGGEENRLWDLEQADPALWGQEGVERPANEGADPVEEAVPSEDGAAQEQDASRSGEADAETSPEDEAGSQPDEKETAGGAETFSTEEEKSKAKGKKGKKKKKSNKKLVIALVIVLVLVIALGSVIGAGLTVVHTKLDKVTQVEVNREALEIDPRVAEELKNYRNIALLGIDARDMEDDSNTRSDAMIIASIDKRTNEVRLVSLYRDTYVSLGADYGLDKLTHAYFYGGATQTLRAINRNLDLNCEEVLVVNWKSVADTVDALGGLEINVKESEIKEMNKYIKDTQRTIGGSKKLIKKAGKQTLNGNQAVTYARIRKDSVDGDHRRNERMKIVLAAAFKKATTLSVSQLNNIANEILPDIKTNMSTNQMMEILLELNSYKITESKSWPYKMTDKMINNIYYGPPVTLKSNVTQLHEEFFEQQDYDPTDTVKSVSDNISSVTGLW